MAEDPPLHPGGGDGLEETDIPIALFDTLNEANEFARSYFDFVTPLSAKQARKKSPGPEDEWARENGYATKLIVEGCERLHGVDTAGYEYYVCVEWVEGDVEAPGAFEERYGYVVVDVMHQYNDDAEFGGDESNVLLGAFGSLSIAKAYARGFLGGRDYIGLREPEAASKQRAIGLTTRVEPLVQKKADSVGKDEDGHLMEEESDEGDGDKKAQDEDSDDWNRNDGTTARWVDIVKLRLNSGETK